MAADKAQCPICDTIVDATAEVCPDCGTSFKVLGLKKPTEGSVQEGASVEDLMADVPSASGPSAGGQEAADEGSDLMAGLTSPAANAGSADADDILAETPAPEQAGVDTAQEAGPPQSPPGTESMTDIPTTVKEVVRFECPMCRNLVDEDAPACPECGVEFSDGTIEVEEAELEAGGGAEAFAKAMADSDSEDASAVQAEGMAAPLEEATGGAEAGISGTAAEPAGEPDVAADAGGTGNGAPALTDIFGDSPRAAPLEEAAAPVNAAEETHVPADEPVPETPHAEADAPVHETSAGEASEEAPGPAQDAAAEPAAPRAHEVQAEQSPAGDARSEKELYRELAKLVGQVKPLLLSAKKLGANIAASKKLIDGALLAGKAKDYLKAIELVNESRSASIGAMSDHVAELLKPVETSMGEIKAQGRDVAEVEALVVQAREAVAAGAFEVAVKFIREAKDKIMPPRVAPISKAEATTKKIESIIGVCEAMGMDVTKSKYLIGQARTNIQQEDWEKALDYAQQANDDVMKELPDYLTKLVADAKPALLRAKMMNIDISKALKMVKEAKIYIKSGDYMDAIKSIRSYRQELQAALGD